jgi:WD40 repeat protein
VCARALSAPDPGEKPVPPRGPVTAVCFSSDGKWILTGDYLCGISLWSADGKKPVWRVEATREPDPRHRRERWEHGALAVAFAADGKRAFAAWAGGVTEIDRERGTVLRTTKFPKPVKGREGPAPVVVFLPGSDECLYYGEDDRLVRFDFKANKRHEKFDLRLNDFNSLHLALSPDAKRVLVYAGRSSYAGEWDLATGELLRLFGGLTSVFDEAGYTPDGERVRLSLEPRDPRVVLDRTSGKKVDWPGAAALAKYEGWLWYSPDGKRALGLPYDGEWDGRIEVLRIEDAKVLNKFSSLGLFHQHPSWDREAKLWEQVPGLAVFSPDGKTVLLTKSRGERGRYHITLGLWDVASGKHLRTLTNE